MKKILVFLVFINITIFGYSQPNYANGNGTIIKVENTGGTTRTFRRHLKRVQIGDILYINNYDWSDFLVYANPKINTNEVIYKLKHGDIINIEQILEINEGEIYSVWLNIYKDNSKKGWLFFGENREPSSIPSPGRPISPSYCVPYYNNRWEILERINVNNKIWTIRRGDQRVAVAPYEKITVNVYDKLAGTNIISKITPTSDNPLIFVDVIAMSEETETIANGRWEERWLKIKHNRIEGWIFGRYASVERGGIKYLIPEDMIEYNLGFSLP
jgi:hypothetical protein